MAKKIQKQSGVEDIRSVRRSLHMAEANLRLIPVMGDVFVGELAREVLTGASAGEEMVWLLYYRLADDTRYEDSCFCAELYPLDGVGVKSAYFFLERLLGAQPMLQRRALALLPDFLMRVMAGRSIRPVTLSPTLANSPEPDSSEGVRPELAA
jgi:hypothetical protein